MKTIFRLIIIGACVGIFMTMVNPRYQDIKALQAQISGYNTSLVTADKLKSSREDLIARYNNISKADLDNIKTLLPDSVNNIRLIIQLDSLATKNGLSSLRNVDYKSESDITAGQTATTGATTGTIPGIGVSSSAIEAMKRPYGEFTISFQTSGQYANFLSFLSDLEQNLRLVDVTSVGFTGADTGSSSNGQLAVNINYKVTLKTYWLKQ